MVERLGRVLYLAGCGVAVIVAVFGIVAIITTGELAAVAYSGVFAGAAGSLGVPPCTCSPRNSAV